MAHKKQNFVLNKLTGKFCKMVIFIIITPISFLAMSQRTIDLYEKHIPNSFKTDNKESEKIENGGVLIVSYVSHPTLTIFLPAAGKGNGTAVIICPGGGYGILAADHEGFAVAKRFNDMGIAAFVLKYRIPDSITMPDKSIGPLQDAQQAILLLRKNAKKWQVDPKKIGIMGFSAGGHLAASAGTHFNETFISNKQNISLRPDFMILIYPVISFTDSIGHLGSRENLIGKNPSPEKIKYYSNEHHVSKETPPTFLVHSLDDDVVKAQNSVLFAKALSDNEVQNELFLYDKGGHGYGMNNSTSPILWMDKLSTWLGSMDLK